MIHPFTKSSIILLPLIITLSSFLIITSDHGLLDLQRLKQEKQSLIMENSMLGLEILGQIDVFKRLANNDLKLIEHIARSELRMVGKNEIILVPKYSQGDADTENKKRPNFRVLTKAEIDKLLSFDIQSFKFHEKLSESEDRLSRKQPNVSPKPYAEQPKNSTTAKTPNKFREKISDPKVAIQIGAFRHRKYAENLTKKLKAKGYSAYLVRGSSENGVWYKVRIGNPGNIEEALRALRKDGFKPIIVN